MYLHSSIILLWVLEIEDATRKRVSLTAGAGLGDHQSPGEAAASHLVATRSACRVAGQIDCRTRTSSSSESFPVSRRCIARAILVAWIFACSATGP